MLRKTMQEGEVEQRDHTEILERMESNRRGGHRVQAVVCGKAAHKAIRQALKRARIAGAKRAAK